MTGSDVEQDVLEEEKKIVCPNCGHHNSPGVGKCSNCGHPRNKGEWKQVVDEKKRRKKRKVKKKKGRKGGTKDGKGASSKGYSLRDWFKGGGWVQTGGKGLEKNAKKTQTLIEKAKPRMLDKKRLKGRMKAC